MGRLDGTVDEVGSNEIVGFCDGRAEMVGVFDGWEDTDGRVVNVGSFDGREEEEGLSDGSTMGSWEVGMAVASMNSAGESRSSSADDEMSEDDFLLDLDPPDFALLLSDDFEISEFISFDLALDLDPLVEDDLASSEDPISSSKDSISEDPLLRDSEEDALL